MSTAESSLPLAHVLRVVRRRWKLWVGVVVVAALAGLVASLIIPRRYEAEVVALPRGSDRSALLGTLSGQLGGLAALAGLGSGQSGQRAEALQMLQSNLLAREFIQENKLLPLLYASDWDARRQAWNGHVRTLNEGVALFDHRIRSVLEDRRTGLVTVRVTWKDPVQAAAWANELVRRANDSLRERAVARAQASIAYLKREARNADAVEIQQTLYHLMEEQYKTLLLANVSDDYEFSLIDPAVAPDPEQYAFPRKALFTFGGFFFGIVLVLTLIFIEASQRAMEIPERSRQQ
jgi:uncharacterized protein involved in exopolysaccharide biosynthesis